MLCSLPIGLPAQLLQIQKGPPLPEVVETLLRPSRRPKVALPIVQIAPQGNSSRQKHANHHASAELFHIALLFVFRFRFFPGSTAKQARKQERTPYHSK